MNSTVLSETISLPMFNPTCFLVSNVHFISHWAQQREIVRIPEGLLEMVGAIVVGVFWFTQLQPIPPGDDTMTNRYYCPRRLRLDLGLVTS